MIKDKSGKCLKLGNVLTVAQIGGHAYYGEWENVAQDVGVWTVASSEELLRDSSFFGFVSFSFSSRYKTIHCSTFFIIFFIFKLFLFIPTKPQICYDTNRTQHHKETINGILKRQDLITNHNHTFLWLPPYSPDLNPERG